MTRLTEQGHAVFDALTERGRQVVVGLTDAARFVFGQVATTYEKSGGATADWEARGTASRQRKRKRAIVLPLVRPAPVVIVEKAGGARVTCEARGRTSFEKERSGSAAATPIAAGSFVHILRRRTGTASSYAAASGAHIRILAGRSGGVALGAFVSGACLVSYAEQGKGHSGLSGGGSISIIRGDDSEDLLLLGLEPEEEELLLLA